MEVLPVAGIPDSSALLKYSELVMAQFDKLAAAMLSLVNTNRDVIQICIIGALSVLYIDAWKTARDLEQSKPNNATLGGLNNVTDIKSNLTIEYVNQTVLASQLERLEDELLYQGNMLRALQDEAAGIFSEANCTFDVRHIVFTKRSLAVPAPLPAPVLSNATATSISPPKAAPQALHSGSIHEFALANGTSGSSSVSSVQVDNSNKVELKLVSTNFSLSAAGPLYTECKGQPHFATASKGPGRAAQLGRVSSARSLTKQQLREALRLAGSPAAEDSKLTRAQLQSAWTASVQGNRKAGKEKMP